MYKDNDVKLIVDNVSIKGEMSEIGCWTGKSTLLFSGIFDKVYAVDQWSNGYDDNDRCSYEIPMKEVEGNFDKRTSEIDNIEKIKKSSEKASKDFDDESLDFVYIDASHKYKDVKNDIKSWLPKVRKGGWIGGHDRHMKDVKKAITEEFGDKLIFSDFVWLHKI